MAKEVKKQVIEEATEEKSIKEALESLQVQFKQYSEKADYFKTMAIKAEGAIEVLSQLEKDKE